MCPKRVFSSLKQLSCQYAFYFAPLSGEPFFQASQQRFSSASIIKVPILLAWLYLEQQGEVSRAEICDLDAEPQVQGAGFSWLLRARRLPYQDVLLLMMSLSDNLCTNLVIRRAGLPRLNQVFRETLHLPGVELQRKLLDFDARSRGLDNWITAQDCIRLFQLIEDLPPTDRAFVDTLMSVCQDTQLLLRDLSLDSMEDERVFHHKTGSLPGLLHDWGYSGRGRIFLLTQNITDYPAAFRVFGDLGRLLL
jgi:beta-lactamase class A